MVSALFIGFTGVFLPGWIRSATGVTPPSSTGPAVIAGMVVTAAGLAIALWCALAFALIGRGTPAPFDPPRRLVARGPYRFVRNPMYLGAVLALLGVALYYRSLALLGYACAFLLAAHLFVVGYEEPTLRRTFGSHYEAYRASVPRWVPRRPRGPAGGGEC